MHYVWESVGDQDELTRKVCYLGPYLLEHVEESWEPRGKDKYGETIQAMMMASRVYLWNDEEKLPDLIFELPLIEYKRDESVKVLEDWYALNVLAEELFVGDADEPNSRSDSPSKSQYKRNRSMDSVRKSSSSKRS